MRISLVFVAFFGAAFVSRGQPPNDESKVRRGVEMFYAAFNAHRFEQAAKFTTDDWNHINPFGGWTQGRPAVLKELKEVHGTFLKGVSDQVLEMSIRLAGADVAIAVVTSRTGLFYAPDGIKHENELQIRTFVLVRRGGDWLITQDQNTIIRP